MEEFAVQAEGIWKTYGDRTVKTNALQSCSLQVKPGEFVSIIGPSGSGKSTLLHCLAGLITPEKGTIRVGGQQIDTMTEEQRSDFRLSHIGLVFQFYSLVQELTIEENLRLPFEVNGNKPDTEFLEELKDRLEIRELDHKYPRECSGGQQQRVAIARALVKLPKVLLLDEPLSNLDARLRLATREEIRRIQQETGITTVFVTHDQDEAMSISDLIVVMKEGVLQQVDSPQKVYDDPANQFVAQFLGTPPINMFSGEVRDGKLWINSEPVLNVAGDQNAVIGHVNVGIRPEGFILLENGALGNEMVRPEITGRDVSVIFRNKAAKSDVVRSIISADDWNHITGGEVRFDLKPSKVFLFDPATGSRIRVTLEPLTSTHLEAPAQPVPAKQEQAPSAPEPVPSRDKAPVFGRTLTTFTVLTEDGEAEAVLETDAVDTYIGTGEV